MTLWEHAGQTFETVSTYSLSEDAWQYELRGDNRELLACLVIPDLTPEGSFTPAPPEEATLRLGQGSIPWPVWERFIGAIEGASDLNFGREQRG